METNRAIASSRGGFEKFVASDRGFGGSKMIQTIAGRTMPNRWRRQAPWQISAPFDVPHDDGFVGFRRDGDALISVLAVAPTDPVPVIVGAPALSSAAILPAVLAALTARDAAPFVIDIVSHTMGCWSDGPAVRAYRSVLGDVRLAAHRSVHLIIRIRPTDFPHAMALRGDDSAAALRTALWSVRRVRSLLSENGVASKPLTAAEITDLTVRLTEGASVDLAHRTPLDLEGSGVRGAPIALTTYEWLGGRPESLAGLIATPGAADAVSTSLTLRVSAGSTGPTLRVLVRDNGSRGVDRSGEHDLHLVSDTRPAAAAGLPIGDPPGTRLTDGSANGRRVLSPADTAAIARSVPIPLAGDGQLVGADPSGSPVALRLAGPTIPCAHLVGDDALARQVVVRLAALGVSVGIVSPTPHRWERLATSVGEGLVAVDPRRTAPRVIFDDDADRPVAAPPGSTLLRRHREPTALPTDGPCLSQDRATGTAIAHGSGRTTTVRLVSTAAERTLTDLD